MIKKIGLIFYTLLAVLILASCSNKKKEEEDTNKKGDIDVRLVESIDFGNDELNYKDVPIENPDYFQSTFMDVDPEFVFTVQATSAMLSAIELNNSVVATTAGGDNVELVFSTVNNSEYVLYDVKAKDGYEPGAAYTVSINNNDSLLFFNKSPEIRKLIFTVEREDSNVLEYRTTDDNGIPYKKYDIDKVSHFEGFGDYNTYLYYDGDLNSSTGDVVIFTNGKTGQEEDTIYIKIKAIDREENRYKITYESPSVAEVFNDVDIHVNHKDADVERDFTLNDIEEIARQIKYSDTALMYCYAVADKYDFLPQLGDFIDNVSFDVSFKGLGNGITLGIQASYTHTTEAGWRVCLSLKFQWTKTFTASGDVKTKSFLGIPYDVDMNCAVGSDETFTFQFCVTKKNKKFIDHNVDDTPKDLDLSKAKQAVEEMKDRYYELDDLGYKKDIVIGDTIMINIGHLSLYFGYLSIDIDVYACMKLQSDVTLGVSYTYSSHQVLVNYSTANDSSGGGSGDAGVSPSEVSSKILNAYICGDFSIELYLKLRVTAYVTGLKPLANIGVDADAGVYLDVSGIGCAGYNFTTGDFDGNLGATVEFGAFFRASLNVNLLFVFHWSWELCNFKAPFFKLGYKYDVRDMASTDTIELTQKETDISKTNLLVFNALDGKGLAVVNKQFSYDEEVVYFDSVFLKHPGKYWLFPEISSNSDYIEIKNGKIIVKDNAPAEINAKINVTVRTSPFTTSTYTANVHYIAQDARFVTFDGANRTAYHPGEKIVFPNAGGREGYIFRGFMLNGEMVDYRSGITMGTEDLNFTTYYIEDKVYTVTFYDGFNNLVSTQHVNALESAVAPEASVRDVNMEGYTFVCYDKQFNEITCDMEIHAIYERSGE